MINIRQAMPDDAAFIWQVQRQGWLHTYAGIIDAEYLQQFSERDDTERWRRALEAARNNFAIMQYNGIDTGYIIWGKNNATEYPFEYELYAIYILRKYHQLGIGKAAVQYAKQQLQGNNIIVWVIDGNPNTAFYHKVGKQLSYSKHIEIGGKHYVQYAFEV